jgi:predicted dehydrogenase
MTTTDRRAFLRTSASAVSLAALVPTLDWTGAGGARAPLDVAVIGAGRQGRAILGELAKIPSLRVAAVCDVVDSRLQAGLRRAPGAEGFADPRALLERKRELAAVFVATPTHLHRAAALDALAAGKHVYCEAPLASTLEDARAIVKAARSSGKLFQTGLQGRSNPIYALARSFVRAGAIGELVSLRAQYHRKTSWRTPAPDAAQERALNWQLDPKLSLGLVGEFGVQQFDVFDWMLGAYPLASRGNGAILLHKDGREVFDTVHCELAFPLERRLQYEATLANSFDGQCELLHGTLGSVKLAWNAGWLFKEADAPTQGWEVYANREAFHDEQGITLIADATKLAAQNKLKEGVGLPDPPLYYALLDFARSVTESRPVVCTAEEGLRAAAVGILAEQSVRTGETVAIPPEALKDE